MASKFFPSLVATAFAVVLFHFFLKRKSREITGEEANDNAAANDGTGEGDSGAHTSTKSHEMGTSSGYDFEVFLSFRGSDTQATFTDRLFTSLEDAGIRTFKDDGSLQIGEEFAPELLQAMKQSKILIPIFSKDYAYSVWCLKEVVQMINCTKTGGQKIIPIFYDVTPTEVRYQTGDYKNAFLLHERKMRYDEKTIREWKDALFAVTKRNGWVLQSTPNREEGEFVKTFTQEIFNQLQKASLVISDCLISVNNHVDAIMEVIRAKTHETLIIGIYGMGGIGKTTIAKIIYNMLSNDFENRCFLRDIQEMSQVKGIQYLQSQLISDILKLVCIDIKDIDEGTRIIEDRFSNKRVLLLLDDVGEKKHMNALVGKRDWFCRGSKIIITTRNKYVLDVLEVDFKYELSSLNRNQSLQLFSKHVFRRDSPLDEYIDLSNRAIGIARGLPLALEIIGSLLSCTKKEKWDATLKKLESAPLDEVCNKFKISYDALNMQQKHIFLDIACCFIGYDKDTLVHFWDESKKISKAAMEVLENMSLIKINENNEVWMHNQLKEFGRDIVRQESKMKIEKQTRVWNPMEALDLLRRQEGKKKIEALRLKLDHRQQYHFTYEAFESLSNLRFLEVDCSMENFHAEERLLLYESPSNVLSTNESANFLPQLRWLSWHDFPPIFDITNFSMENVVILDLSRSKITQDWKGWSHIEVMKNLKVLNISDCNCLNITPTFSTHPNLERLILRSCRSLIQIDRSICQLKRLVSLDVTNCQNLQRLPDDVGRDLASLEYLSLQCCTSLEQLPTSIGNLESLIELDISGTGIKELPNSIGKLKNLEKVKMHCDLREIPDALWMIEKLQEIDGKCTPYHGVHVNIGNCIYKNKSLRILRLMSANIYALPRLPESLIILKLSELYMDVFPDLMNLTNLKELDLWFPSSDSDGKCYGPVNDPMPRWIENLIKLESLALRFDCETTQTTDLSLPPQLKALRLEGSNLCQLSKLPPSLSSLHLCYCDSLRSIDLSNLRKLSSLVVSSSAIAMIQGLHHLENLQDLQLRELGRMEILPDLSNLKKLRYLRVDSCGKLIEIQGELPDFLEDLEINTCESLQKLPYLSSLTKLRAVKIFHCGKLYGEEISSLLLEKSIEFVGEDDEWEDQDVESEQEDYNYEYESEGEDDG